MTSTATAPARANRSGSACPSWCEIDHDTPTKEGLYFSFHGTEPPTISTPGGYVQASAYQNGFSDDPAQIWIGAQGMRGGLTIDPGQADQLAVLAEALAEATPDQHREFAAQIRQAAAAITEAGSG